MKCHLSKPVRKQEKQEDDIMFFFTELSVFLCLKGDIRDDVIQKLQ